jgi:outer membrane lipase/esterase
VIPSVTSLGPAAAAPATALSKSFNALLTAKITALAKARGIALTIVDTGPLIDDAIVHPGKYHFTNVTEPCWTGSYIARDGALCSPNLAIQNQYLFWDMLHPTAQAHKLIASAVYAALKAPTVTVSATPAR